MILIWFGKRRLESRPIALLSARITTVWNFDGWNFDGWNHDFLYNKTAVPKWRRLSYNIEKIKVL